MESVLCLGFGLSAGGKIIRRPDLAAWCCLADTTGAYNDRPQRLESGIFLARIKKS